MYAACVWAVVPMDLVGGLEPWYDVCGIMRLEFEIQRAIKRVEIWALFLALSRLQGPAQVQMDDRGVVHAFNTGGAE